MRVTARARYNQKEQPATVYPEENGCARVVFDEPQRAMTPGSEDKSEAAAEAITEAMNMAMMNYMPLRGALSFGGGAISAEEIENLLQQLNSL